MVVRAELAKPGMQITDNQGFNGFFTVHATLVYVRDFLPDFNIALETAADNPEPELAAAGQ